MEEFEDLRKKWSKKQVYFKVDFTWRPSIVRRTDTITFYSFLKFNPTKDIGKQALREVLDKTDKLKLHTYLWCKKSMVRYYRKFGFVKLHIIYEEYHMIRPFRKDINERNKRNY